MMLVTLARKPPAGKLVTLTRKLPTGIRAKRKAPNSEE